MNQSNLAHGKSILDLINCEKERPGYVNIIAVGKTHTILVNKTLILICHDADLKRVVWCESVRPDGYPYVLHCNILYAYVIE